MSEDLRQTTIDTYNHSAQAFVDYFAGIGSRATDVDRAFRLAGDPPNPNVLELGCGDGRDARVITEHTSNYLGTDVSSAFIELARKNAPQGKFEIADMIDCNFPKELDIVFAFASLLHLNKSEVHTVCHGIAKALRPGGIFYISTKYREQYAEEVQEDRFGTRLFYYYNPELMAELAGHEYTVANVWNSQHGNTGWFELALRKI